MFKKIPSGAYFLVTILFFTPWWSVSCAGQHTATYSGIQTVTGFEYDTLSMDMFRAEHETVPPQPLLIGALLLILGALFTGLMSSRKPYIASGIMGILAGVLLLVFKAKADAEIYGRSHGMAQLNFGAGYWLSVAILFITAISQYFLKPQKEHAPQIETQSMQGAAPQNIDEMMPRARVKAKYSDRDFMPPELRMAEETADFAEVTPVCPVCKTPMVLRTYKNGPESGNKFWGCTNYPQCGQTKQFML